MTNTTPVDSKCSDLILDIQKEMGQNSCPTPQVMREIFNKYYPEKRFAFNHAADTLEEQCGLGKDAGAELTEILNSISNQLRIEQPRSVFVEKIAEKLTPVELGFLVEHLHNRLKEALMSSAGSFMSLLQGRRGNDDGEKMPWDKQ
jgi:hypothetical protein